MHFSQMLACEADQYTDTEFLSVMNDVITMETSYVLEATYGISSFFIRIWKLISGIFNFIYKLIAGVISFIRVKILGKSVDDRKATIRPASNNKSNISEIGDMYFPFDTIKVPIDISILKPEIERNFVHMPGATDSFLDLYFKEIISAATEFLSDLENKYKHSSGTEFNYSFSEYCSKNNISFLTQIINTQPDKIIYTESIKDYKVDRSGLQRYWTTIDVYFGSVSRHTLPNTNKYLDKLKHEVDKNKNIIDSITTKFPGAIDDFLKFINMISLHFNQFKNVVAELSKAIMSNTTVFK